MTVQPLTNDRSDVTESSYLTGTVSVSTTEVEAKVGSSRLDRRQSIILYNKGANTVYYGPTGVTSTTGIPLFKFQTLKFMQGNIGVFLICATSESATVIIQELS